MTDLVEPARAPADPEQPDDGTDATIDATSASPPGILSQLITVLRNDKPRCERWISRAVVLACMFFVFFTLRPGLIFADNTPTGGDMGAHVLGPAFLRDELLPRGMWSGWSPDWYSGFPLYHFYMVVPSLVIVLLDALPLIPYGVAFKMVAASGPIALPLCAYAFGRLVRLRFPGPAMLAIATLPFLYDRGFTIYGGNIASMLAGEYNFGISIGLCVLYLGLLIRYLREGKGRALTAVVLAACVLCHLLPGFYAAFATVALLIAYRGRRALSAIPALLIGVALTAWWALPFYWRRHYTTDMGWEKKTDYFAQLFPGRLAWALILAGVALIAAFGRRDRAVTSLALCGIAVALAFRWFQVPENRLWNARLLPFWYLTVYLLAGLGAIELARAIAARWRREERWNVRAVTPAIALAGVLIYVGLPMQALPLAEHRGDRMSWMAFGAKRSFLPYWIDYNFGGYEGRDAYPEYANLVDAVERVGRQHGCGRALWEYDANRLESYGTTMSLMLLPYWTDSCIGSEEGLYFESSATTPFHFLTASEAGKAPSRPVSSLKGYWRDLDLEHAVEHMQLLGIRYYMAVSTEAIDAARGRSELVERAKSGPWVIFEVPDSEPVTPIDWEPYVEPGSDDTAQDWLRTGLATWDPLGTRRVYAAPSGPSSWKRIRTGDDIPFTRLDPVVVSAISTDTDRISFQVDKTGVPVLVRSSYFPNWKAHGADGPYRVTPNLMVVIPRANQVTLSYERTSVEWTAIAITLVGIVCLIVLAVRDRRTARRATATGAPVIRPA